MAEQSNKSIKTNSYGGLKIKDLWKDFTSKGKILNGTLVIKVDGKKYSLGNAMVSGGCICKDTDWNMWAEKGDWEIDLEEHPELEPYKEEITRVVN